MLSPGNPTTRLSAEQLLLERVSVACSKISGHKLLAKGNYKALLEVLTENSADALSATRCSLWKITNNTNKFVCLDCFDSVRLIHSADLNLPRSDHPVLFGSLESRFLEIHSSKERGLLEREFEAYMDLQGLCAILAIPLRAPDHETALLLFEYNQPGQLWSEEQKCAAGILGSLCSRVLADHLHVSSREIDSEARQQVLQIVDFLPDPAFILDKEGIVLAWNEAIENLTGIHKDLIVGHGGQLHSIAFYGLPRPMLIDLVLRPNKEFEATYDNLCHDGDTLSGEAKVPALNHGKGAMLYGSARPLYDRQGQIIGAIETLRDLTVLKSAEQTAQNWKRRYEMVSAASGQITYELELDSGALQWSNTSSFVLGYQLDQRASHFDAWLKLVHEEDRRQFAALHEESLATSAPISVEYRIFHNQGLLWFRDHSFVSTNSSGHKCRIGMIVDISTTKLAEEQLKNAQQELELRVEARTAELENTNKRLLEEIESRAQAQKALASSEHKYRSMVDALPQIVYELDLQGTIIHLNKQGFELGGVSPEALSKGASIMDYVHPEDRGRLHKLWAEILATGNSVGNEYRFLGRAGGYFHATSYARLVKQEGLPPFVTGFLIDETPRIKAREALEQAHAQLERRVEERTAELAERNAALHELLARQDINIGLASRVLQLINNTQTRNRNLPSGLNLFVAAQILAKNKEGGDHFFSRTLGSSRRERTLISLKDQSGHEVGCILRSIITDLFHNALLSRCTDACDLGHVITRLNQELCYSHLFADGEYLTAVCLEIEHATLKLNYLCAGHPPFLLLRGKSAQVLPHQSGQGANLPLGLIEGAQFQHGEIQLQEGDQILLYSDGLLDLPTAQGMPALNAQDLGQVLESLLHNTEHRPITAIAAALLVKLGLPQDPRAQASASLPDDLSLVLIEIEPRAVVHKHRFKAADLQALGHQRTSYFQQIENEASHREFPLDSLRLGIALEEAFCNAWKHGSKEDPEAIIELVHSFGNDLHIGVTDHGDGFDVDDAPDPSAPANRTKPSGRGLFMIRRFSDQALWKNKGRELELYFASKATFTSPQAAAFPAQFQLWK